MVINTNISAQNAATLLQQSSMNLSASLARLSSGSKIVNPSDDSAGLAVSMKMGAQIARTGAAQNNVNNALSFSQTQDGYLQQVNTALTRMSELAVSAQDVTKSTSDRALYNNEYQTLGAYVADVATKTFNGVSLFSGGTGAASEVDLDVTSDSEKDKFVMTGVNLMSATYNTVTNFVGTLATPATDLTTAKNAATAVTDTEAAINQLATDRATVGSNEEALGYYNNQLSSLSNNLGAAKSQITDVDVATESTNYAKENILVQSGTAMLAQANSMPQSVLRLLS
jgi:flagellin